MIEISKKSVFLTGATGYLGSYLLRRLILNGNEVYCLRRKTSSISRVNDIAGKTHWVDLESINFDEFFKKNKIDFVVHCATNYGRKEVDPILTIQANLILPLQILHAASCNNVSAFINTDTVLDKGVNNYSLSKKQFLDWLESYSEKITGVNMELEHFFGPGDDRSKFVTFITHELLNNAQCINLTPGMQKRDFIYIEDVIDAFDIVMESLPFFEKKLYRFQIGSGRTIKIKSFVKLLKRILNNKTTTLNFGATAYRNNEVMESEVDLTELKKLGWKPRTKLIDSLRAMVKIESMSAPKVFNKK